jgi:hypothetical protein
MASLLPDADITAFNDYVKQQMQIMSTRRETTQDLVIHLFMDIDRLPIYRTRAADAGVDQKEKSPAHPNHRHSVDAAGQSCIILCRVIFILIAIRPFESAKPSPAERRLSHAI